jgi:hypothetical protein
MKLYYQLNQWVDMSKRVIQSGLSSVTSQQFTPSVEPHMLYDRIIKQGTINEKGGKPEPQFALPATVNWMHALRILATDEIVDFQGASSFYQKIGRRDMETRVENTVFEQQS